MKKPRHIFRKILLVAAAAIFVAVTVRQIIWLTSPTRFYSKFLYTSVSGEDREIAEDIYSGHSSELLRVSVAENSRSRAVIRFVFETEQPIEEAARDDILSALWSMMDSTLKDGWRSGPQAVILHWEVFFCSEKGVDELWTSALSYEGSKRSEGQFSQWSERPEYARQLTVGNVRKLLRYTWCSEGISDSEIAEIKTRPYLWTAAKLFFQSLFDPE